MKRQQLIYLTIDQAPTIPELLFLQNTVILEYKELTPEYYIYIHVDNLFVLSSEEVLEIKNSTYTIEGNYIHLPNKILNNKTEFGKTLVLDYMKQYRIYHKTVYSLKDTLRFKDDTIEVLGYNNLLKRIKRLEQFTDSILAAKILSLFEENIQEFDEVASVALITNDFDELSIDIKIKFDDELYVYDFNQYSTFIDTFTKYYFYHDYDIKDRILFNKYLIKYPIPMIVYSILNYNLSQNINRKTNQHDELYNKILKEFDEY